MSVRREVVAAALADHGVPVGTPGVLVMPTFALDESGADRPVWVIARGVGPDASIERVIAALSAAQVGFRSLDRVVIVGRKGQ